MHLKPLVLTFFAAPLAAQAVVTPAHFTNAEANTWWNVGFGESSAPTRFLQILEELQGSPRTINAVSLRRDGANPGTAQSPAHSVLANIFVSSAVRGANTPDAIFDNNHGGDKAQVGAFHLISLPAVDYKGFRGPFDYRFPFAQPFSFAGTAPLCVEYQITSRTTNVTINYDWASGTNTNPGASTRSFGTGCKATGRTSAMTITGSSSGNWAQNSMSFSWSGSQMTPNSVGFLALGFDNTNWAGLPLPFELPGTASAPSGACRIYTSVLLSIPALTTASGGLSANFGFNVNTSFNGASMFSQYMLPDVAANPWGFVLSNGVEHHIVAPWTRLPIGCVRASSLAASGTVAANQGYVMRID